MPKPILLMWERKEEERHAWKPPHKGENSVHIQDVQRWGWEYVRLGIKDERRKANSHSNTKNNGAIRGCIDVGIQPIDKFTKFQS